MPPLMTWTVASPLGGATPIMPITRTGIRASSVGCDLGHVAQRDAERIGHTLAVARVGLEAIADVSRLDVVGHARHRPAGIGEKRLLLGRRHQPEERTGLGEVVAVLAMVPVVGRTLDRQRRLAEVGLLLPLAEAV